MPSKVINTIITNDKAFSVNFKIESYDKNINSQPTLNIWSDIQISLKQEEKINSFLYYHHGIKRTDSLESISELYYQNTSLWWLILVANDISDPFDFLDDNLANESSIKIIKAEFLGKILKENSSPDIMDYLKGN